MEHRNIYNSGLSSLFTTWSCWPNRLSLSLSLCHCTFPTPFFSWCCCGGQPQQFDQCCHAGGHLPDRSHCRHHCLGVVGACSPPPLHYLKEETQGQRAHHASCDLYSCFEGHCWLHQHRYITGGPNINWNQHVLSQACYLGLFSSSTITCFLLNVPCFSLIVVLLLNSETLFS